MRLHGYPGSWCVNSTYYNSTLNGEPYTNYPPVEYYTANANGDGTYTCTYNGTSGPGTYSVVTRHR